MEKLEALASVIVPSASSPRGRGGGGGSSGSLGPCSAPSGGGSATATPASCGIRPGTGGACCATPTGTCDAPASARFRCGCGCTSGTMLPVKSAHSTMRSCTQAFRTESGHRQGVPSHLGDVAEPEASRSQARAAGCAAGAPRRSCTLPWAAGCAIPADDSRSFGYGNPLGEGVCVPDGWRRRRGSGTASGSSGTGICKHRPQSSALGRLPR